MRYVLRNISACTLLHLLTLIVSTTTSSGTSTGAPSLSSRIVNGLKLKYPVNEINRVLTCWDRFERGEKLDRYVDDGKQIYQQADCFVDGLTSEYLITYLLVSLVGSLIFILFTLFTIWCHLYYYSHSIS